MQSHCIQQLIMGIILHGDHIKRELMIVKQLKWNFGSLVVSSHYPSSSPLVSPTDTPVLVVLKIWAYPLQKSVLRMSCMSFCDTITAAYWRIYLHLNLSRFNRSRFLLPSKWPNLLFTRSSTIDGQNKDLQPNSDFLLPCFQIPSSKSSTTIRQNKDLQPNFSHLCQKCTIWYTHKILLSIMKLLSALMMQTFLSKLSIIWCILLRCLQLIILIRSILMMMIRGWSLQSFLTL